MTKIAIDFIGHHRIHFQSLLPIIQELSADFECRELMGPDVTPSGASIAVVTDHLAFQPQVTLNNYSQLIHVSHDLSDVDVYRKERSRLQDFSLILAPSDIHKSFVTRYLPRITCRVIGWTKDGAFQRGNNSDLSYSEDPQILFAWTDIKSTDWRNILLAAAKSKLKFKIKNHVYFEHDLGLPPPKNQKNEFLRLLGETRNMIEFIQQNQFQNISLIDSGRNLTDRFFGQDILVTDYSSAALEFARFGVSIETGMPSRLSFLRTIKGRRATSALVREVRYISEKELIRKLPFMTTDDLKSIPQNLKAPFSASEFLPNLGTSSPKAAAAEIKALVFKTLNSDSVSFKKTSSKFND